MIDCAARNRGTISGRAKGKLKGMGVRTGRANRLLDRSVARGKKRPPISPAWMQSKSGKSEGRGAAITRKRTVGEIHFRHIFWTEFEYTNKPKPATGSIG